MALFKVSFSDTAYRYLVNADSTGEVSTTLLQNTKY